MKVQRLFESNFLPLNKSGEAEDIKKTAMELYHQSNDPKVFRKEVKKRHWGVVNPESVIQYVLRQIAYSRRGGKDRGDE